MEEKRECYKGESELVDEKIYRVLFTAGTALLMACLKRAIMMIFIEQWRLWVFLLLNLVLLAIFFTSIHSTSSDQDGESSHDNVDVKAERMKRKKQCGCEIQESKDNVKLKAKIERRRRSKPYVKSGSVQVIASNKYNKLKREERRNESEQQEGLEDDIEPPRLSKEELNERVEAFIATFRQHLVSDARKGREPTFSGSKKQAENFRTQRGQEF